MNPYTLTMLRHGETEAAGPPSGHHDVLLTQAGAAKMNESWKRLSAMAPVSTMATSPLLYCREFAVRHALEISAPLKVEPRFADYGCDPWQDENPEAFHTRVLTGFSEWIASTRGSHRVLVTHGEVITTLMVELLLVERPLARMMTIQPGGFVHLSIMEDHPAFLMHLEAPRPE